MWSTLLLVACATPAPAPTPPEADVSAPDPDADLAAADSPEQAVSDARAPARAARTIPNRPPVIEEVRLVPTAPKASDAIRVEVGVTDRERDELSYTYAWYINGGELPGVTSASLSGRYKKGDTVRVRATVDDGTNSVEQESEILTVANTAPVFVTGPNELKNPDGFTFRATDADDDTLVWRLEGAPAGMNISPAGRLTYKGSEHEPGGDYTVAVICDDGDAYGRFEFPVKVSPGSAAKK